jgi:hypothetical protein
MLFGSILTAAGFRPIQKLATNTPVSGFIRGMFRLFKK